MKIDKSPTEAARAIKFARFVNFQGLTPKSNSVVLEYIIPVDDTQQGTIGIRHDGGSERAHLIKRL
ncbi:MAG: hypothetical protein C4532_08255 [Candidatus Abyssobacteria bacterium SURF_17]|uniref:Uncharacterized protein n=1 Tax=Candidatus Abyssobacteria bacterium SURF_17 TaxID=2093361 RepID=A0A419F007_9BACT|nr:MAG: hypothetical protein C4532_08255 [Candidatus Abyssubacteria bacterium SURF_17]